MKTLMPLVGNKIRRLEFITTVAKTMAVISALPVDLLAQGPGSQRQSTSVNMKKDRMMVDRLDQAERYIGLHPAFKKAFLFLRQKSLSELTPGKHEIDGDRLYCTISKGPGRKRAEARLEAHRRYIDIQFVVQGIDEMGWRPTADCTLPDPGYDDQKDLIFFKDPPKQWVKVPTGSFAIFFPETAHAPLVSDGIIHKVVVKVAVI
jgi:biofilm protein TabA